MDPVASLFPLEPAAVFEAARDVAVSKGADLWVVGGYLRDRLLSRPAPDVDLVTTADVIPFGRALADALGGHYVTLDTEFGVGRVALRDGTLVDVAARQGETLAEDLDRRDLTINALALPLVLEGAPVSAPTLVDPTGGLRDLEARQLRTPHVDNLVADPVRLLRVLRFAAALDFTIEPATLGWIEVLKRQMLETARERLTSELCKILALYPAYPWIERLYGLGVLGVLIPEVPMLERIPAIELRRLTGMAHALETSRHVEGLMHALPPEWREVADRIRTHCDTPLGPGVTEASALKLGAFLRDVGRPFTLTYAEDGTRTFPGHANEGGGRAEAIADRMKASSKLRTYWGLLARQQEWPELLAAAPEDPVLLYRAFRAMKEATVGLLLLALADRMAAGRADAAYREALGKVLVAYFRPDAAFTAPRRLVDGAQLMRHLGLRPGPVVGRLLEATLEAQLRGEVRDRPEALAWAEAHRKELESA